MNVSDISVLKCPESSLNISSFFLPTSSHLLLLLTTESEPDDPLKSYSEGVLPVPSVSSPLKHFGGSCLSLSTA